MKTLTRVALAATIATYLLIFIGGLVRVSGAGLGCPDWPKCFGQWWPPTSNAQLQELMAREALADNLHQQAGQLGVQSLPGSSIVANTFNVTLAWIEYGNRLVGVLLGLIVMAAAGLALRREARRRPDVMWPLLLSLPLVGITGWMGKVVVEAELHPRLVSAHLFLALLTVSLLIYGCLQAHRRVPATPQEPSIRQMTLSWFVVGVWFLTLLQLVIGASIRGEVDSLLAADPTLLASGELLHRVGPLKHLHLILGIGVAAASYGLALRIMRRRAELPTTALYLARLIMGLVLMQVLLGFAFGKVGMLPLLKVFHLWLASIIAGLWVVLYVVLRRGDELPTLQPRGMMKWGVGGLATALAMGLLATVTISHAEASRDTLPIYATLPDFSLEAVHAQDADGAPTVPYTRADLLGRYTIACFMFTRCPSICPIQSREMAALNHAFAGATDLQFLSISVDPDYDSPDVLRAFGRLPQYDALPNWSFTRGELEATKKLAGIHGFLLQDNFPNHSPKLVLIDTEGRIRGYYDSLVKTDMDILRRDLTRLIGPAQAPRRPPAP